MGQRFERALGILLLLALRGERAVPAAELARRFEVSTRTIHRDLVALAAAGVPVYAERGRAGGVRLIEGYVLPPLMLSQGEASALLLGLALLRSLHARPFPDELDTAQGKLLAALPAALRATLARAAQIIGVEAMPTDVFHPEPDALPSPAQAIEAAASRGVHELSAPLESATISVFMQAILDRAAVRLRYRSPYRQEEHDTVTPLGMIWDRDRWYLAGRKNSQARRARLWRADRVAQITPLAPGSAGSDRRAGYDVRTLLGRRWLRSAMAEWRQRAPVAIRLSPVQADRLRRDWYYRHARFELIAKDAVVMTFGEDNRATVLELLRWLGPGAELLQPAEWRDAAREELLLMAASYAADPAAL